MIETFEKIEDLKKGMDSSKIQRDIDSVLKLDLPFFDYQDKVSLLYFPTYQDKQGKCLIIISKKHTLVYSSLGINNYGKKYKPLMDKPNGESTIITFLMLKTVLKNFSEEFQKIRNGMNELDMNPVLERIEDAGRALRRLTDRLESLVELIIVLKQQEIKQFDTRLVNFDYEVLTTEARYWLERCRSHIYRIASLRTKSEMQSNRELNDTMSRLTVIMTFLTIVSIVVSVPGTVGAIFGIPALSEAYFSSHTHMLLIVLIIATLLSVALGLLYWKSLGLKYKK
jgi:Mg2+ and Co2+ transporter CorA